MTAPTYFAMGGVIFAREHAPMTLEKAETIKAVHLSNVSRWLEQDHLSMGSRLKAAAVDQSLADEMAAAIAAASAAQPLSEAA
jgi:hypothetical protein